MWAYCDTSALVRRYVNERGRAAFLRAIARRRIVSSVLLPLELQSAIGRRVREGRMATVAQPDLLERIDRDTDHWTLVELGPKVAGIVAELLEDHPVRTLDAIHIASARVFSTAIRDDVVFVTADARQARTAARSGLTVVRV